MSKIENRGKRETTTVYRPFSKIFLFFHRVCSSLFVFQLKCLHGQGRGIVGQKADMHHARSHAYASGLAKLYWRNDVVHFLRAYFIPYVIRMKWITCVQEKTEFSSMSQRTKLSSTKAFIVPVKPYFSPLFGRVSPPVGKFLAPPLVEKGKTVRTFT